MYPPRLLHQNLPEQEHDVARQIEGNLSTLSGYVDSLAAALALFDHAAHLHQAALDRRDYEALVMLTEWMMIAARDGALTIYHFAKVWQATRALVRQSPTISALVDTKDLKKVGGAFETGFPHWAALRKGVAHRGDFGKDQANINAHATDDTIYAGGVTFGGKGIYASDNLMVRTYFATVDGRAAQYDVSEETVRNLAAIRDSAFAAFEKAEIAITGRSLAQLLRDAEQFGED